MTAAGYVVRDITLTIDGEDYECAVLSCVLTPETPEITWATSCPDGQGSDVGSTKWTLDLSVATDSSPTGLARILQENSGDIVTFSFVPDGVNNPTQIAGGSVRLKPIAYGGTADQLAQADVSLNVIGQPVWTP